MIGFVRLGVYLGVYPLGGSESFAMLLRLPRSSRLFKQEDDQVTNRSPFGIGGRLKPYPKRIGDPDTSVGCLGHVSSLRSTVCQSIPV